jgi:hypothetical protein
VQLAAHLGLEQWQLSRARQAGLIGGPDRPGGRWSAAAAAAALVQAGQIRDAAGSVPDLGAVRAAGVLSARLGVAVSADGVEELARLGLLPVAGCYKGWSLYDGRGLEAFTDAAAAAEATWAGQLRTTAQSAAYLRIRRSDLAHLTRSGMLIPAKWGRGPWDRRGAASVPLYRTGDLDQLAARTDIDWAAVRATPPRGRSRLAAAFLDRGQVEQIADARGDGTFTTWHGLTGYQDWSAAKDAEFRQADQDLARGLAELPETGP